MWPSGSRTTDFTAPPWVGPSQVILSFLLASLLVLSLAYLTFSLLYLLPFASPLFLTISLHSFSFLFFSLLSFITLPLLLFLLRLLTHLIPLHLPQFLLHPSSSISPYPSHPPPSPQAHSWWSPPSQKTSQNSTASATLCWALERKYKMSSQAELMLKIHRSKWEYDVTFKILLIVYFCIWYLLFSFLLFLFTCFKLHFILRLPSLISFLSSIFYLTSLFLLPSPNITVISHYTVPYCTVPYVREHHTQWTWCTRDPGTKHTLKK